MCADEVTPSGIPCCGMAGDRGMRFTELSGGSLQHLDVPSECSNGYSSSKTCEIALSHQSGLHHRGLMYLVDECTRPKRKEESTAATSA
jgi:D-lactate dehydrogenase